MRDDSAMLGVSEYDRADDDFYPTIDGDVTKALINHLLNLQWMNWGDVAWECAAGAGHMVDILKPFFKVIASDIAPRKDNIERRDFLRERGPEKFNAIITNPPYGDNARRFMERGLRFLRDRESCNVVAMLARNEFDCAKTRQHLFGECPEYAAKIVLTWRPRWFERSVDDRGPRHNFAWYIWRKGEHKEKKLLYGVRNE